MSVKLTVGLDETIEPVTVKFHAFVNFNISVVLFLTIKGSVPPSKTLPLFSATVPNVPLAALRSPLNVPPPSIVKFVPSHNKLFVSDFKLNFATPSSIPVSPSIPINTPVWS